MNSATRKIEISSTLFACQAKVITNGFKYSNHLRMNEPNSSHQN